MALFIWTVLSVSHQLTTAFGLDHLPDYYDDSTRNDRSEAATANGSTLVVVNGSESADSEYPLRNRNLRMAAPYHHTASSAPKSILTVVIIVILVMIIWMFLVSVVCALTGLFSSKKSRSKPTVPGSARLNDQKMSLSPKHQYRRNQHRSHNPLDTESLTNDKLSQKDDPLIVLPPPSLSQLPPTSTPPPPPPGQSSSFTNLFGLTSLISSLLHLGNQDQNGPNGPNNNNIDKMQQNSLQKLKIYNPNNNYNNNNNNHQNNNNINQMIHFKNRFLNGANHNFNNNNNSKQKNVYKHQHNPHCRINNQFNSDDGRFLDFSECIDFENLSYKSVQSNFTTISQVMFKKDPKTNTVRLCNV